jgi:2-C-methyl-D-erythritol 4-phosphate cytidylyltransferase
VRAAIIVAGGSGERLGLEGGKQLARVSGRPLLSHTLAAFDRCPAIDAIVVVVHPARLDEYRHEAIEPVGSQKVVAVVAGGDTRQGSVAAGLAAVPAQAEIVAVHDGARPLVTPEVIGHAIEELEADATLDGVVVGHPSYDTLKIVDESGAVVGTVDRDLFWAAQTPQVFRVAVLREAYARAAEDVAPATDDAALVERCGGSVRMIVGPRRNIKITVAEDLSVAAALLEGRVGEESDG